MRELLGKELSGVAFLTANDVPHGLLELTATGLEKSILDATEVFREYLQAYAIHDYDRQPQGPDFKVLLPARVIGVGGDSLESRASLYRPQTKSGDPRIWFRELGKVSKPGDVIAAVWHEQSFWIFNLSVLDLESAVSRAGIVADVLGRYVKEKAGAVESLLALLHGVSEKGYLPAPVKGPTAVGRLLETELGIAINSRRDPDFRGIEIKSSRNSKNRTTLFAKTPNWSASRYKSSRELLTAFGYDREGRRKLSCTISGKVVNSQGLSLSVDDKADLLHVLHTGEVVHKAVEWELEALRHSLATKHNETFWVKAETKIVSGWEYIRFTAVQHTQKPIVAQLSSMLGDGKVTVDFLIREEGDKGYLFKLLPKNLPSLFPPAREYALSSLDITTGGAPRPSATLF